MEIIPNWHPIFVHFTVALLITSVGFYLLARFDFSEARQPRWSTLANWNLWAGAAITVLTVAAGIYAFYTVDHDTPSHEAMIEHRNWAIPTFLYFFAMATWAWRMAHGAWRGRDGAYPRRLSPPCCSAASCCCPPPGMVVNWCIVMAWA